MPPLSPSQTWSIAPKARSIPAATHRLELIEALRGFALFGVLLVNLRSFSLFEFMGSADGALLPTAERRDGPFSRALQPMRLLPPQTPRHRPRRCTPATGMRYSRRTAGTSG